MLICPLQETWVPYLGRHSRHKISATYSCQCVQCLHVSKQSVAWVPLSGIFNVHTDGDASIARWGCTNIESLH